MPKNLKILQSLKICFVTTISIFLVACPNVEIPEWHGKLYAGDSKRAAVVRGQADEVISCRARVFDEFICMTGSDFQSFYDTYVLSCKDWGDKATMPWQTVYNEVSPD
jgi:hypothetical protein